MKTYSFWIYRDDKTPKEKYFDPKKPGKMTNGVKIVKVDSLYTDAKLKKLGYLKKK